MKYLNKFKFNSHLLNNNDKFFKQYQFIQIKQKMNNNTPFEKQNNELNYFEETTYKLRPGNIREIKQMNSSEMQSYPCKQLIIKNTQTCIGHYLEDEGAMEISKLFNKTKNLSQLGIFLYKNKITDVGFLEILKGMKQLPNLDSLLINMRQVFQKIHKYKK
ncbi:hypothetical protein PPERSA_12515 [Pseudocohnilembus persalinus]|uniref:Uncharacterized protein n=1 Tax=Pseudocohnilembus persalinus TaxID=266149 RepID=A0A0V0QPJ1_PSEPJ|nr:hypothetical protein PPERSA_12515 [Pseudocohnilembus persalinus]|eukprot:KRX04068.1 hypothetical protein PPERSA_12515 [Pseudocohnilembus persalinus]